MAVFNMKVKNKGTSKITIKYRDYSEDSVSKIIVVVKNLRKVFGLQWYLNFMIIFKASFNKRFPEKLNT